MYLASLFLTSCNKTGFFLELHLPVNNPVLNQTSFSRTRVQLCVATDPISEDARKIGLLPLRQMFAEKYVAQL